jgi:small conductance mechanosensitive channel
MTINVEQTIEQITELSIEYGYKLIGAIVCLWIGWKVVNVLCKALEKWFDKTDYDEALETFIHSLVSMSLRVILVITCASIAEIPMTSFVAILGAAGLAIGMALSGTLQNFAGGVLILILKPFKVGDFIEAQGHSGKVRSIQIFNTIINTGDNKRIILPNGPLATGSVINYSAEDKRRVDFTFGISYSDDIDQAKELLSSIINADERVHSDPEPLVAVHALADNSVNIIVRAWADASDYWGIYFDVTEKVKKAFDKEGLSFPFPQTDIHLHKVGE